MLQLRYNRKRDPFQYVKVLGDADGIRDLYWQLTHNYRAQDGTEIGVVSILNMEGLDVTAQIMTEPHQASSPLSNL